MAWFPFLCLQPPRLAGSAGASRAGGSLSRYRPFGFLSAQGFKLSCISVPLLLRGPSVAPLQTPPPGDIPKMPREETRWLHTRSWEVSVPF